MHEYPTSAVSPIDNCFSEPFTITVFYMHYHVSAGLSWFQENSN